LAHLSGELQEKTRELRYASQRKDSAERREELLRKEVEMLRAEPVCSPFQYKIGWADLLIQAVSGNSASGDQGSKIKLLEGMVEQYKSELEDMARDSQALENQWTQGAGLVKEDSLLESQRRVSQLETGTYHLYPRLNFNLHVYSDIGNLESTISELTTANTTLDAEVNDLMRRVASGEYNPANERCLELKNNPGAKIQAIRRAEMEELQASYDAVMRDLTIGEGGSGKWGKDTHVPLIAYKRVVKEKEDLEVAHAKRLQRLKEVCQSYAKPILS
jgi:mitotic spindle assembly checkpoint protein MAD1